MAREFAGYLLEERAFVDAVSSIWHGHSTRSPERRVTVRLFGVPEDGGLAGAMYSFREDADAATRLTHDRVVATDEIARRDGHTYIVSPYTPAIPLSHHLQGGVPGPDRALALLGPLAGALDAAARTDLAHGAVHPRTIWVVSDPGGVSAPRALLSGFGLHHLLRVLAVQRRADVVDDFLYVAPELLRGGRPSTRSDQYALAAAFLHAMTGRPPFEGEHLAALFGAHLYRSPPPVELDDWMAALALDEILARSLAKNPDHRFERCHDFVDAVAQWQHQYRTASAAAGADAPDREPAPVSAAVPVGAAAAKPPSSEPAPDSAVPAPDSAVPAAIARRQPWRLLRIAPTPVLAAVGLVVGIIVALIVIPRGPSPAEPDKEVAAAQGGAPTQVRSEPPGVRWRRRLGAPVSGLYVTTAGVVAASAGSVAVLDSLTGEVRAQFDGGRPPAGVTGEGGLLIADGEGLTAHDIVDGSVEWRSDLTGIGPPTVSGQTVYGISDAAVPQLIATDADTGERLWQFPGEEAERAFPVETAVAPADGFVYLADSGALYGILPKGASVGTDTAVIAAGEPAQEPLCVWKAEVDEDLWLSSLQAVSEGVVVADRSGNVCLRRFADGEPVWCVTISGVADAGPSLLPSGDHVFVVTRTRVIAIDIGTGERAWSRAGRWRDAVRDERGQLVVVDSAGAVTVMTGDGDVRTLPGIEVPPPAVLAIDGDVLYAAEADGTVVSADLTLTDAG